MCKNAQARCHRLSRASAAALLAMLLAGCASPRAHSAPGLAGASTNARAPRNGYTLDMGALASAATDPAGGTRVRALGPFFESRIAPDGKRFLAVRPFYSRADGPEQGRVIREALWPVASTKDFKDETFWHFLLMYGHDFERHKTEPRYRLLLLPVLFAGRSAEGERYFAIFPLGGRIDEFLYRDKIVFALFPLYSYSTFKDVKTHSILWPIISSTKGEGVSRFRVFPLYGKSVYRDQWKKTFVLWPLWTTVEYSYPNSKGSGYMLFPLVSHIKLTDQETWMLLPPFFRWSEGTKQNKLYAPWPFVQRLTGETDLLYLWPLWGKKREAETKSWFCAWPVVSGQETQYKDFVLSRFRILPFIQHERRTERPAGGAQTNRTDQLTAPPAVQERYFKLWPLLSYARQGTNTHFRIAALWPALDVPSIEKNYAPLWTLYSHRKTGAAGEHELLWGMYRQTDDGARLRHLSLFPLLTLDRGAAGEAAGSTSLFFDLLHYERNGLDTGWRLLYLFKFGSLYRESPKEPDAQP